jgi:hypothetical protein
MSDPPRNDDGLFHRSSDGPPGPSDRAHSGRGLAVVVVAVVLGVLLLPSATRAPLFATASAGVPSSTTTPPGGSTSRNHKKANTTTTTTVAPATVHVLVANATTVNGVAGAVTTFLGTKGFSTLTATNALTRATSSQIYIIGGATADATAVADALSLPVASIEPATAVPPVPTATGANVVVIAGPDLATRFAPGSTTTAPAG